MASANKTSLGLNQWIESDKPRMEDFNSDNKIINTELEKIKIYTNISELGIKQGQETITGIAQAMRDNSILIHTKWNDAYVDAPYPHNWGVLTIKRSTPNRISCTFDSWINDATFGHWWAMAKVEGDHKFSGWKRIV